MKMIKVKVKRHSKLFIILHWLIVIESIILLLSGLALGPNPVIEIIERGTARALHISTAFIFMGTTFFLIYYFIITGEYQWFGIRKLWAAIDFFIDEIRHFLLGKPTPYKPLFDLKRKIYIRKIIPTEVLAWWGWIFLWISLALTGLAILYPNYFGLILRICHFLTPDWVESISSTMAIHAFLAILYIVLAMIHAYASWRFNLVKSVFTGEHEVLAVEDAKNLSPENEIV